MKAEVPSNVVQLRRTYRGEEEWFPLLHQVGHRALRQGFIAVGVTPAKAAGLVFFLDDQANLDRHQSEPSRVNYRRQLERLDRDRVAELSRAIPGQRDSVPAPA